MKQLLLIILCLTQFQVFSQEHKTHWVGTASYYDIKFNGRKTKSGERFNNEALSAANNFIKLGTQVKVTNLKNNSSVVVTINDHMHHRNKRLIDLSAAAAKQLGFYGKGLCKVSVDLLSEDDLNVLTQQAGKSKKSLHTTHHKRKHKHTHTHKQKHANN